jgi:hypothetical protein
MNICLLLGGSSSGRHLFGFLLLTSSLVFYSAAVMGRRFSNAATAPSRQRWMQCNILDKYQMLV